MLIWLSLIKFTCASPRPSCVDLSAVLFSAWIYHICSFNLFFLWSLCSSLCVCAWLLSSPAKFSPATCLVLTCEQVLPAAWFWYFPIWEEVRGERQAPWAWLCDVMPLGSCGLTVCPRRAEGDDLPTNLNEIWKLVCCVFMLVLFVCGSGSGMFVE